MTAEQLNNKILNDNEYSNHRVKLQSTPLNIIFNANCKCNMGCIFCLDRCDDPDFSVGVYKNFSADKLQGIIKRATHLFYTGWGEVLLLPRIEDFIDYLNNSVPDAIKTFTTNGVPLNQNLVSKLIDGNYAFQISLHTSDPLIHRLLTQSDYFEQIVMQIKYLTSLKKDKKLTNIYLSLIFIATNLNIENLPNFIDFATELGVYNVTCSYLTIFKTEHIKMSCFFLQETTNRMFDEAKKRAEKYGLELFLPPRFGTGESLSKVVPCRYPWDHFFVDVLGNIFPCCYAGEPIGNLNKNDFFSIWNGKEYRELRSSIIEGRLHRRCQNCFKFFPSNVDDIRAHITLRSGTQAEIFKILGLERKL